MSKLIEAMKEKKNYHGLNGVSNQEIDLAQVKLGVSFSDDYKDYTASVGIASFDGHELTGVCSSPRLDVVKATEKCRKLIPGIKPTWYVLEELNIDQITIWQDTDGAIYRVSPHAEPVKIAQGIGEYINI